ncbi:MAG: hypothetical protein ACYCXT_09170 [Acidiferrobacteraceae bacterium]
MIRVSLKCLVAYASALLTMVFVAVAIAGDGLRRKHPFHWVASRLGSSWGALRDICAREVMRRPWDPSHGTFRRVPYRASLRLKPDQTMKGGLHWRASVQAQRSALDGS